MTDTQLMTGWGSELLSQEDIDMVGAMLAPGSAAAVIVYENTWAGPFAAAMIRAGGEVIAFDRVRVIDFLAALDAGAAGRRVAPDRLEGHTGPNNPGF